MVCLVIAGENDAFVVCFNGWTGKILTPGVLATHCVHAMPAILVVMPALPYTCIRGMSGDALWAEGGGGMAD